MNRTSKITALAAASMIALTGLMAAPSFAQVTGSIAPATDVIVQRVDALDNTERTQFDNISNAQLSQAQDKLASNTSLSSQLQSQGVQLKNVVKVIEFSNGGALVYLR